jgi:hypothetical protein
MTYQLDPVKWLAARERRDAFQDSGTITPFTKAAFPTATLKNREDTGSTKGLGSIDDFKSVQGKKALYGDKFNEIGDTVNMFTSMDNADAVLSMAQENKKYQDALMAKQRAACKSNKRKGLFGSIITGGIGIATGNPALIASGASGALGSMGGC